MGFEPAKEKFWGILVAPLHAAEFEPALTIDYLRSDQG
jgi:hypothetical protein